MTGSYQCEILLYLFTTIQSECQVEEYGIALPLRKNEVVGKCQEDPVILQLLVDSTIQFMLNNTL